MANNSYNLPDTSVALLNDLGRSSESQRWETFIKRYDEGLRAFLKHKWNNVDEDEVVQRTYLQLIRALPNYHYVEGQPQRFRNWLLVVCSNEAKKFLRDETRHHRGGCSFNENGFVNDANSLNQNEKNELSVAPVDFDEEMVKQIKDNLAYEATEQILKDTSISERDREIFRLLTLEHQEPTVVADRFGLKRGHIDKIKCELMNATRKRFKDMLEAAGLDE